jgi:hypothetical protein
MYFLRFLEPEQRIVMHDCDLVPFENGGESCNGEGRMGEGLT